jgi:hypothetical protein
MLTPGGAVLVIGDWVIGVGKAAPNVPSSVETSITPPIVTTTRKGVPGDVATFPNGLKDVHAMTAAADALNGLHQGETSPAAQLTRRELGFWQKA